MKGELLVQQRLRFLESNSSLDSSNVTNQTTLPLITDPSPSSVYVIPLFNSTSVSKSTKKSTGLTQTSRDVLISVLSLFLIGVLIILAWRGTLALLRYMRIRKLQRDNAERLENDGVAV